MLGTAGQTVSAPGITSAQSRQRQSGPVEIVTTDASGNLASDGGVLFGELSSINRQLSTIDNRLNTLDRRTEKAFEGVAMSMAMASAVPYLSDSENFAFSGSFGAFETGNQALAFGVRARVSRAMSLGGGLAVGVQDGSVGGTVNARWGW
jgi:hypothetical protein